MANDIRTINVKRVPELIDAAIRWNDLLDNFPVRGNGLWVSEEDLPVFQQLLAQSGLTLDDLLVLQGLLVHIEDPKGKRDNWLRDLGICIKVSRLIAEGGREKREIYEEVAEQLPISAGRVSEIFRAWRKRHQSNAS